MVPPEAFSIAIGNPTNASFLYGMSAVIDLRIKAAIRQQEDFVPSEEDRLIERLGPKGERLQEKVADAFHVHLETLAPEQFMNGSRIFLDAIGLVGLTMISIDEQPLRSEGPAEVMNLQRAMDLGMEHLQKGRSAPQTIDVNSSGRNTHFLLWLNLLYRRRHMYRDAPVEVEVKAMSKELGRVIPRLQGPHEGTGASHSQITRPV